MGDKLEKAGEKKLVTTEDHLRFNVNFRKELKKVLGKIPPEHFVRMALTAMQKQPKLANCSQASVFQCLLDCASVDLEPDGRRAHLIPYGETCTLVIDYKGYVDLMTRPGKGNEVAFIDAAIVYDKDDFEFNMNKVVRHRFDIQAEDRGKPIAAYVAINYKNGMVKYELMVKSEIESIKNRSKAVIAAKKYKNFQTPWYTDELEMWKKCPLRRAAKWVPINDQTVRAMEIDYDRFEELEPQGPKSDAPEVPLLEGHAEESEDQQQEEKPEKKAPKEKKEQKSDPATSDEPPPDREPGQDDDDDAATLQGDKKEIFTLLSAKYRGDQEKMAGHLQRLSAYKAKSGFESKGKRTVDMLSQAEAKITLKNLREELGIEE